MGNILADIKRCFHAESVSLPSGLDIISMASLQHPGLFASPKARDGPYGHITARRPKDITFSHYSDIGDRFSPVAEVVNTGQSMGSTNFEQWSLRAFAVDAPTQPISVPQPAAVMRYLDDITQSLDPHPVVPNPTNHLEWPPAPHDSGYSSLNVTPNPSLTRTPDPSPGPRPGPYDGRASESLHRRILNMVFDRRGMTTPCYHCQ